MIPRLLIAGTSSKVGKTTIAVGLMRLLTEKGYNVQPFKVGPDFIDPSFHYFATGRKPRNLDSFMMSEKTIIENFCKGCRGADIAVIEGKTGLYDSADPLGEEGSSAHISKILKAPVILTANAERMNRSIAAMLLGYKLFDSTVDLKGVILNKVGSERHSLRIRKAVESVGIKVFGTIPRSGVNMPYRHLGLVTAYEREDLENEIGKLAKLVEKFVDVEAILDIALKAPEIYCTFEKEEKFEERLRLGVVMDQAFSFYYTENLEELEKRFELTYINSLKGKKLPKIDALYIGGGFPEVFAENLEKNEKLREDIYNFCESGNPVYAECGGLMFLGKSIETKDGEYEMVGFLPLKTKMFEKFQAQGYSVYRAVKDSLIAKKDEKILGHEFHYSKPELLANADFAFKVERGYGFDGEKDGIVIKNVLANYLHLNFLSNKNLPKRFYEVIKNLKN